MKDIAVYVDEYLTFETRITTKVIKKADSIIDIVRRLFTYLDMKMFVLLFKALVRQHLEYALSVCSPCLKKTLKTYSVDQPRQSLDLLMKNA